MSPDEFRVVVEKIRPYTDYIYLHVLGEPLLTPHFDEIVTIAQSAGLFVNITTNGAFLVKKRDVLLQHSIRQINISLHDAEENIKAEKLNSYLDSVLNFAVEAAPKSYISLRLWNSTNKLSADFNQLCLSAIATKFNLALDFLNENAAENSIKLAEHIFFQRAPRFEWPDENSIGKQESKTCYALRDHIAILVDGTVVPCCLDADANMLLGNIFTDDFHNIITSKRAVDIKKGFEQRKIVEPICASCGFIID